MTELQEILNIDGGESDSLDFKESFNNNNLEWFELIKDIVAMTNSGGGFLIFGINDDGALSGKDVNTVLSIDPADITNKIFSFTGTNFSNFKIIECSKDNTGLALISIGSNNVPIVFTKPGNYQAENGRQKNVFSVGSVYFRHGAKSEPCTSDDLRSFLEREINRTKDSWLKGIRQVVEAPEGANILVISNSNEENSGKSNSYQLVDDISAPTLRLDEKDIFELYPFGYSQLMEELKNRYSNFVANREFHKIRKPLLSNPLYCKVRLLNPKRPKGTNITLYSKKIFNEFDKYYKFKEKIN